MYTFCVLMGSYHPHHQIGYFKHGLRDGWWLREQTTFLNSNLKKNKKITLFVKFEAFFLFYLFNN